MASPHVRRQIAISFPPLFPTSTSQSVLSETSPPSGISSTSSIVIGLSTSTTSGVASISVSSLSQSTSSLEPTSTLTPSMPAPPFSPMPNGQVSSTSSSSSSSSPPLPSGPPETKGKSFLQNKPLSGFVFGLAGLAVLIVVIIAVTSYVRRRNRKRLLTDASNFSFDPKDVEDGTSAEEKYSPSGHTSYHNSGHGHAEHALGTGAAGGFAGAGMGGVSRPVPSSSPPMPVYIPQDYAGHDGVYPAQYYNLNNVAAGYNPTPNPYDMYGPRHGGYSSGQGHYGQFNPSGPGVDYLSVADPGHPVPRQLQPGIHPTQSPTFAPVFSTNPPPLNRSPPLSPPPASLQRSASNQYDLPRLPTPDNIPDTFGRRGSGDDDAYSGAFLGHDSSPPGLRTLQVANM